jgi:lipopolysaccharide export system protein LptA
MVIAIYPIICSSSLYRPILLMVLMALSISSMAQRKIKLEPGAHRLIGFKKDGVAYTSVTGDVKFTHKGSIFYCDSAVLAKKTNYLEAYGNVRIFDTDSVTITASSLLYDGNSRVAKLRNNVVLTKLDQLQIFTDFLDYDRNTGIAVYFNNGKIVDSTNVLTSEKGYYNSLSNMASFKTNVVGKNDDYTMVCDTLVYNTITGVMYFVAPTTLTDNEEDVFYYEGGQYHSKNKRSNFFQGKIETESYFLAGDNMHLDDIRGVYQVSTNVTMLAKENDIIITGQEAVHTKSTGTTKVYNNPLMKLVAEKDTLYVSADTLVSIDGAESAEKRLLAYSNVKIFKNDLQGVADSLAYYVADSILFMFGSPVLWSDENQMTADSIQILVSNGTIQQMNMVNNAFVITKDSADNFNQIKGRSMAARFVSDQLSEVFVSGNGESIFFMYDEDNGNLLGMNKIICSDIGLYFEDQKLTNASFLVNPEGDFIPPHLLNASDKQLSGFVWRADERPVKEDLTALSEIRTPVEQERQPIIIPDKKIRPPDH